MWTPSGWPMGQTGTNVMWPYPYASGWQNQLARYSHGLNPAAAPVAPSESTSTTNSSTSGTPQTSESSGLTTSSIPIPSYTSSAPTASPPHAYPPNPSLMSYPIAHLSSFNSLNYNVNPVVQHPYAQYSLPMNMAPSIPIPQPSLYQSTGPDPSLLVPSSKSGSTPPPKTPASNSAFSSVHKPLASPLNRKRASGDSDTPPPFVPLKSVKVTAVVPDHSDSDGENSLQARQQRPFQCVDCGKRFRRSDHLQSHVKSHNGEYPYVCALCDKTFKRSDHMIIHMRGHSGEKPFDCQQCKKSYSSKSSLMRHKRIHNHM